MRREGDVVSGHRLIEKVGEGHFGEVWKAEHEGRLVALKIFARPYRISEIRRESLAQFALGRLPYPHGRYFPQIEHIDLDRDPPIVRMELINGVPLEQVIAQPTLNLSERLALGERILEALAVVHGQGFIHGDLSPLNILVTGADGERTIQLIDVGFGALLDDDGDDVTHSDVAPAERPFGVASPLYAAPERFKSDFLNGCGKASDVFSYGKILYRLITGESPYIVKPVTRRYAHLSPAWDDFIFQCLEERPEARFADAGAALTAYRGLCGGAAAVAARTECPECEARIPLGPARVGDRFACPSCGASVELLGIDPQSGFADAATVATSVPVDADVIVEEAVKFCPSCGEKIRIEAQKCRFCGVWVEEFVRRLQQKNDARVKEAEQSRAAQTSFVTPAIVTLLMYLVCWLPGAILNLHFLADAARAEATHGERPPGADLLNIMVWLFVYLPLIFLISIVVFGMLGSVL